ncbi:glycosyltransferase family 2 protein, partial [Algoriphagus sp.]
MNTKSCVIIPYYKSGHLVLDVLRKIPSIIDFVYIVDDNSPIPIPDCSFSEFDFEVIIVKHETNKGVGGAMKTGFRKALENEEIRYFYKVDSDDQMDLSQIFKLQDHLISETCDFVKGNRLYDITVIKRMPFVRRFGNLALSFITKMCTGYWGVQDPTNGYFGISREA